MTPEQELYFFENCGENRVRTSWTRNGQGHFVDPLLKLHNGIPLMLSRGEGVRAGHATGASVVLQRIVLKKNATIGEVIIDGVKCPCVQAEDVIHLVCRSELCGGKILTLQPTRMYCKIQIPVPVEHLAANRRMILSANLTQFPVVCSNATTGHRIQGLAPQKLIICTWSPERNWNYVALSRVATRARLLLLEPLPNDVDFSISPDLVSMLHTLRAQAPRRLDWNIQD